MSTARMSQPETALRDPLIGARVDGRYRIRSVHGRGGMGIVYAAVHEDLRRDVAVKVLDKNWASDRNAIERFLQEARTASGLSHGNIVDVLDLGRLPDGRPYLVMPLIIGSDLATVLAEDGPQHPKRVASLLTGVASALDLIHAKGLVHHDIKPENLMRVRREDGSETVVVLDFGIAGARFPLDGRGMELFDRGTPEFMPPEAASGVVPDRRGDIYALATVSFELMTGRLPFDSNDDAELATLKATRPPSSMTYASGTSFPLALEAVVARGLATRPAERYATAGEFVRRLAHVADQIADDFLTRTDGSNGPVLQAPTRPQRRAVESRSRTLMTAGGLARASAPAPTAAAQSAAAQSAAAQTDAAQTATQTPAAQASVVTSANTSAQTLPQMHAVEVVALESDPPLESGAPPSAEAMGVPEVEPAAAKAPSLETALPAATGPSAPSEEHTTEVSGTFLRKGPRDTRNSRSPLRSQARASDSGPAPAPGGDAVLPALEARRSVAPPITIPPPVAAAAATPAAPVSSSTSVADAFFIPDDDTPVAEAPVASAVAPVVSKATAPMFTAPSATWPVAPAAIRAAYAAAKVAPERSELDAESDTESESDAESDAESETDVLDDAAIAAEFGPHSGDERETLPGDLRPPRSLFLHPALLTVFGAALLFWLYAILPDRDLTTEELPSAPRSAAPSPILPHSTPRPALAAQPPPAPSAPAPVAPSAVPTAPSAVPTAPIEIAQPSAARPAAEPSEGAAPPASEDPATRRAANRAARAAASSAAARSADSSAPSPARTAAADRTPTLSVRPRRAADEPAADKRPADKRPADKRTTDARTPSELVHQAEDAIVSGKLTAAADLYQLAIMADSSYAPAYRGKGLVLERLGKTSDAANAFRAFLRLSPDSPAATKIREHLEALSK